MYKSIQIKKLFQKSSILQICKGALFALCVSLISILLFAFVLKFFDVSTTFIITINQIIKVISILFGIWLVNKKNKLNIWCSMLIGALYSILAYIVFSILSSNFTFDMSFLYNLLFSSLIALICGIIFRSCK